MPLLFSLIIMFFAFISLLNEPITTSYVTLLDSLLMRTAGLGLFFSLLFKNDQQLPIVNQMIIRPIGPLLGSSPKTKGSEMANKILTFVIIAIIIFLCFLFLFQSYFNY